MMATAQRRFPAWFWLLWLALSAAFFSLMHIGERSGLPTSDWEVTDADFLMSDAPYPPLDTAAWQRITLPLRDSGAGETHFVGWLRMTIPAANAEQPLTLSIPAPNFSQYALWLGGRELEQRGMNRDRVSLLRHPIAFQIPANALPNAAPRTHLLLRVNTQDPSADLQPMLLGPADELVDYVANSQFMQQTLVRAIMAMMAVMSFLMAIIHRMRYRQETVYGWYALGMFAWLIHTGQGQLETAPFAGLSFWIALGYVTLPAFVVISAIFTNRVIGRPQQRVEVPMLIGLVLGSLYIFYRGGIDGSLTAFLTIFWIPATIVVGSYNLVRMVNAARAQYSPDVLILLAATAVVLVVGIRDYLYNNLGVIAGSSLYLKYAAGLVLVVFSFVLIRRFSSALSVAEDANLALQQEHQQNSIDTGADYRRVMLEEHRLFEAQIDELLQSVSSTDALAAVRLSLNAARNDMQLITDALSASAQPADHLIESLHQRLEAQSVEYHKPLLWQVSAGFPGSGLKPHQLLSLGRFIQIASREAFESEPVASVQITTQLAGQHRALGVEATGPTDPTLVFNRQLQYQRMAAELNATVAFETQDSSCCITLTWTTASE